MRILLLATNRHDRLMSRMHAQPLPIGLAYVAGHVDQHRHTLKVLDLMFAGDDYLSEVETTVRAFQPDLVGISIRNLSNHSYLDPQWQLPIAKAVIERIRATSQATIVCGGPAFSILPRECFAYVEPDLGITGDAGETFAELADRLHMGDPSYLDLPGLVYREGDQVMYNGMRSSSKFSKPPRLEDLDMAKYREAGFGIGVLTKLSGFYYPAGESDVQREDGAWRVIRPIGDVVTEVRQMEQRFGLRKIFFIDNCFNIPLAHAKALCRALMDADLKLHWNTALAPYSCDAELVGLMKQAGCALVLMGAVRGDSHDGPALDERLAPIFNTCRLCEDGGLHYTISLVFGEPGETRETVERKLEWLRGLKPAIANLRVGESILPGTAVAAKALGEGLIADERELIRPTFYLAAGVRDWMLAYLQGEAAKNPRWNLV
ncbi:MAG: cobalamin B12-binding domain-containing protein [Nitrospinae bacterium]|nr:cobalamin B12-binding domain-containing protein [Nitrospinota bacterium]